LIVVIGSINLDLITMVDRLPGPGETVPGDNFATAPGGKGANQALAAARAGASVRMVGAVGRDAFAPLVDAGAAKAAGIKAGDHVVLQLEVPMPTVSAALDAAREARAVSLLNTAPFRADAVELLGKADYVVANETEFDLCAEALSLPGKDREARMQAFAEKTGRAIVVTLGGDGVVAFAGGKLLKVPALKIEPVDTVGAGDTFCGYLASGLSAGLPLERALRRAASAASLACLKPGAQPSIPLAAAVDAALSKAQA
jgi:ribokinase